MNSFKWVPTGNTQTGVQTIGEKEIRHPKMWDNLVEAKAKAKLQHWVEGVAAGRIEVERVWKPSFRADRTPDQAGQPQGGTENKPQQKPQQRQQQQRRR